MARNNLEDAKTKVVRFFHQLRSQTSADYYLIYWLILIVLVAGIDAASLAAIFIYLYQPTTSGSPVYLIGGLALYYLIGLVSSLLASRILPVKRIVAPIFSQAVAGVLLIPAIIVLSSKNPQSIIALSLFAITGTLGFGIAQDFPVVQLLGRAVVKEDVPTYSLRLGASVEEVRNVLLIEKFADTLGIREINDEYEKNEFDRFRSTNDTTYDFFIEITRGEPDPNFDGKELTILDLAVFDKKTLTLLRTEDVEEYGEQILGIIERRLNRSDILLDELPTRTPDDLVDYVILEQKGFLEKSDYRISTFGKVKIGLFIALLIIGGYFAFFGVNQPASLAGWGIVAATLGIGLLIEAPKRIHRRART